MGDAIDDNFVPTVVSYEDWAHPHPEHEGERVLWSDGSVHAVPERGSESVTVLRRRSSPL